MISVSQACWFSMNNGLQDEAKEGDRGTIALESRTQKMPGPQPGPEKIHLNVLTLVGSQVENYQQAKEIKVNDFGFRILKEFAFSGNQ